MSCTLGEASLDFQMASRWIVRNILLARLRGDSNLGGLVNSPLLLGPFFLWKWWYGISEVGTPPLDRRVSNAVLADRMVSCGRREVRAAAWWWWWWFVRVLLMVCGAVVLHRWMTW